MIRLLCVVAVLLCCLPGPRPAEAAYMTGKDLTTACLGASGKDLPRCVSYVAGVIDYHIMMQSLGTTPTIDFCLPADLPPEKAAAIVIAYLRKSPQHEAFIAAPTVILAMNKTFPCKAAAPKKKKK